MTYAFSRSILAALVCGALACVAPNAARSESVPEAIKRHEDQLKALQNRIDTLQGRIDALQKALPAGSSAAVCTKDGANVGKFVYSKTQLDNGFSIKGTGIFVKNIIAIRNAVDPNFILLASNAEEINNKPLYEKRTYGFSHGGCKYSLFIEDIATTSDDARLKMTLSYQ